MKPYFPWLGKPRRRRGFGMHSTCAALALTFATSILSFEVFADSFTSIRYDPSADQLVISMAYRGTNPNHTLSLRWGQCKDTPGSPIRQIAGDVLDSQWQDKALNDFTTTTRFSLADFHCRPAKVTLRTAPRFHYTLLIPAASVAPP